MTLSPYDTGERLSPIPWVQGEALRRGTAERGSYGKVDFDNDESTTVVTAHIEKRGDGYTLHAYVHGDEDVEVALRKDDKEALIIQPSEALQTKVQETIDGLYSPYERDEAQVYWQDGQALILVPGEKHVRKQQIIMVHEPGYPYADIDSAIVKGWESGVQRTRLD